MKIPYKLDVCCPLHPAHNADTTCPHSTLDNTLGTPQRIPGVNGGRTVKTIGGIHYPLDNQGRRQFRDALAQRLKMPECGYCGHIGEFTERDGWNACESCGGI